MAMNSLYRNHVLAKKIVLQGSDFKSTLALLSKCFIMSEPGLGLELTVTLNLTLKQRSVEEINPTPRFTDTLLKPQAENPNCSSYRDVTILYIYSVRNGPSWLDSSDREKCVIKHRRFHLLIPNVDKMSER